MCFVNKVLVVVCFIVKLSIIGGQDTEQDSSEDNEDAADPATPMDQHTFVALIDIVFTDGSRKTCTGTLIHDYVVITAAHCFVSDTNKKARAELTASFVVIGTKKMFETGYEQYLPIERVVTHPKFKGWTADLSLVFTFAGMTSDKPGTVISLAGDKTSTPVDSNVTVLSWGHSKDDHVMSGQAHKKKKPKKEVEKCSSSESEEYENAFPGTQAMADALRAGLSVRSSEEVTHKNHRTKKHTKKIVKKKRTVRTTTGAYRNRFKTVIHAKIERHQIDLDEYKHRSNHLISRYLTQREQSNLTKKHNLHKGHKHKNKTIRKDYIAKDLNQNATKDKRQEESQNIKLHYKNWRRRMGPQKNKLTVEVFGFVNMQTCKKFVEKAMSEIYEIKGVTDVICYASDEHLITAEDSGAPAIRHGQLVAVTVGGAECDGDHVAVGMKMSCYCSWIADNLPPGGPRMQCCKNCCDVTHIDDHTHKKPPPKKNRNKYL